MTRKQIFPNLKCFMQINKILNVESLYKKKSIHKQETIQHIHHIYKKSFLPSDLFWAGKTFSPQTK